MCLTVCMAVFIAVPVSSVWARDTDARLRRIENENQTLSRAVFRGEQPPPGFNTGMDSGAQAGVEVRLQQLETELRTLTGRIEQQDFEIRRFKDYLEKMMAELEMRVGEVDRRTIVNDRAGGMMMPSQGVLTGQVTGQPEGFIGQGIDQDMPPQPDFRSPSMIGIETADTPVPSVPANQTLGTLTQDGATGVYN